MKTTFDELGSAIRACRLCAPHFSHMPRPVFRGRPEARILIAGQAPGTRVHASGLPFDDRSGVRLRDWLGMSADEFYDETKVAVVPMGFCYPGQDAKGADKPPRPECAPLWRSPLLAHFKHLRLTLPIGLYAQRWHLGTTRNLTETVAAWRDHEPAIVPLPHPSWRNNAWLRRNPWFERDVLPELRGLVRKALA